MKGLEGAMIRRLLCGVRDHPIPASVIVGSIAAAATTGALLAMGHRAGHAAIPFAAIGAVAFQRTSNSGAVGLVFTGFVLHVATMFVWAFVYVGLAQRLRRPVAIAIIVATVNFFSSWVVAWSSGRGIGSVLPLGDRLLLAVILAGAYVAGMRYAFPSWRDA